MELSTSFTPLYIHTLTHSLPHSLPHSLTHSLTHCYIYIHSHTHTAGTPERAILSAFMNAGAAHGIASACHENLIDGCQCETEDTERINGITYLQSCADNVDFAISFLRNFNRETEIPSADQLNIYLMDQWNNELGYEVCNPTYSANINTITT